MKILPKTLGTRPRLAVEIRWGGVVAARAEAESAASAGLMAAVSRAELGPEAIEAGLKPGNFRTRAAVIAAVRKTLEAVHEKGMGRQVTLVVPDAAVRVLLLDFDTLPTKAAEALPVVRFRLKKLLPFDADDAMISFQIMSSGKGGVRVLAAAVPRDVLEEYESAVREAGFEPGCILPSTLAALSGMEDERASLLVNANALGVTTAIVRSGILLLHRTMDMHEPAAGVPAEISAQMAEPSIAEPVPGTQQFPLSEEIAQAVNVAAAYFEDTLSEPPHQLLSAGPLGAEQLANILAASGIAREDGLRVRELVESKDLLAGAATSAVPRAWLSGVLGALRA